MKVQKFTNTQAKDVCTNTTTIDNSTNEVIIVRSTIYTYI